MKRKTKIIEVILILFIISLLLADAYRLGVINSNIGPSTNSTTPIESPILKEWPHGVQSATDATVGFWFNGWGWASILGTDDCNGASDAIKYYASIGIIGIPTVAYLLGNSGYAQQILSSDSELALHYPHDWQTSRYINASTAIQLSEAGKKFIDCYGFASKWDDPAYGGKGKTFISMANPGDESTIPMLTALWEIAGIRIDGRADHINSTALGSWYSTGNYQPTVPFDLMNIDRQICADSYQNWASLMRVVDKASNQHGVVTVYGHPVNPIKISKFLHWLVNTKTNYSSENWLANQGEIASYIYGRNSLNLSGANGHYQISRPDPTKEGYWNVPVTVAINMDNRTLGDVTIKENNQTLSISSGTIQDMNSSRVMTTGYDIRNGILYVSEFWSRNSTMDLSFVSP
jgi:hypothetical protein